MAEFEHIPLLHKIAEHLEESNRLLKKIDERLERIERRLPPVIKVTNVTGGEIREISAIQQGENLMATAFPTLGPGVSAKFQVTWTEADGTVDASTVAAQTTWTSSDPTNFPAVMDPADPTGTTVDVAIPETENVAEEVTLTVVYANADGTSATVEATYNLASGVVTQPDVTSGTLNRIA